MSSWLRMTRLHFELLSVWSCATTTIYPFLHKCTTQSQTALQIPPTPEQLYHLCPRLNCITNSTPPLAEVSTVFCCWLLRPFQSQQPRPESFITPLEVPPIYYGTQQLFPVVLPLVSSHTPPRQRVEEAPSPPDERTILFVAKLLLQRRWRGWETLHQEEEKRLQSHTPEGGQEVRLVKSGTNTLTGPVPDWPADWSK